MGANSVYTIFSTFKKSGGYSMNSNEILSINLSDNLTVLRAKFGECSDVIFKNVLLDGNKKGCFIYIEGLVDINILQRDFLKPVLSMNYFDLLKESIVEKIPLFNTSLYYEINLVLDGVLTGETVLLIDGSDVAISCSVQKFEKRSINEPEVEKNIRGPHEGFIEAIDTNISFLRRKIKDSALKFKTLKLGNKTNQTVAIAYIEGIANPQLLTTLYNKISSINTDGISAMGSIQQFISDSPNSLFPQYQVTERPDKAVACLLEGQLIVLLDGTPVVLIAPVSFFTFFSALDDYSMNWIYGSFLRFIRFMALIIAIMLPALYIAVTTFQYYIVPLDLLIPLAESRSRVPFPPIVEAMIMEITIELIREGAVRLPTYVGATIGVIGGIIIGQAAVNAGIVSTLLIIVVAVTAIASYVFPTYDFGSAIRLLRFIFMIITSIFGAVGLTIGNVILIAHLISLESLGQPYFQPLLPFKAKDLKDTLIRLPLKYLQKRPDIAKALNKERGKK